MAFNDILKRKDAAMMTQIGHLQAKIVAEDKLMEQRVHRMHVLYAKPFTATGEQLLECCLTHHVVTGHTATCVGTQEADALLSKHPYRSSLAVRSGRQNCFHLAAFGSKRE